MKKDLITLILLFFNFSILSAQIAEEILTNSSTDLSHGLGDINIVGTSTTVQNASATNPCRMFGAKMNIELSKASYRSDNFFSKYGLSNLSGHYASERIAFGLHSKQQIGKDYIYRTDTHSISSKHLIGLGTAIKINEKWIVGLNINHLRNWYENQTLATSRGYLNINSFSYSLATLYSSEKEISNIKIRYFDWGFSINAGQRKNDFLPDNNYGYYYSKISTGTKIGWLFRPKKKYSVHLSFLYQADKHYGTYYRPTDYNSNGVIDLDEVNKIGWLVANRKINFYGFSNELLSINHNLGVELLYRFDKLYFGFRKSYFLEFDNSFDELYFDLLSEQGFTLGYNNLYINLACNGYFFSIYDFLAHWGISIGFTNAF